MLLKIIAQNTIYCSDQKIEFKKIKGIDKLNLNSFVEFTGTLPLDSLKNRCSMQHRKSTLFVKVKKKKRRKNTKHNFFFHLIKANSVYSKCHFVFLIN